MVNILAKRYARALFDYSPQEDSVNAVYRDLAYLKEVIQNSPEFKNFLQNPTFSFLERHSIIKNLFEGKISPVLLNFILFLSRKNRLDSLNAICEAYGSLYRETHGILPVKIISGLPLSKEQSSLIARHLGEKFHKEIEPQFTVDAGLLGGIKVQIHDDVYDFSLKTQLENFKAKLLFA